jgi:hypothetical protein
MKFIAPLVAAGGLLTLCPPCLFAAQLTELRITEFLANAKDGIVDEDGDDSDWIELWNASGVSGELGGWYLTDDPEDLTKWELPNASLTAGGRVVVFASGKDRAAIDGELHANFKLQSEAGGYLALVRPDGVTIANEFTDYPGQETDISYGIEFDSSTQVELIGEGAAARWLVPSGEIPGWRDPGFDDSSWSSGTTGIGYDTSGGSYQPFFGGGDDLGNAMRGVNQSAFIRIPFTLTDPTGNDQFLLRLRWEDGFAAFLNGVEITRQRAPETLAWNSGSDPASGRDESDAVTYFDYEIPAADLQSGGNVLAIHGLNQSLTSSDFLISPLLEASKQSLGNLTAGYFTTPTPGEPNYGERFDGLVADTKFSSKRGTYDTAFSLEITSATPGAIIRYTTDGSIPTESSGTIYNGAINMSQTTVMRALAYRPGFRPTNVDTHTYIFPADVVNQPAMRPVITGNAVWGPQMVDAIKALPSLAITMTPSDINYPEIPVSIELLDFEHGNIQCNAGARRVGGRFTAYEKRSYRLHFRSEYGNKKLNYPVFDGYTYPIAPVESFDSLDVRAGNQDMIHRGAYLSNLFTDNSMMEMGQPAPHGRFVHLYFNGRYRGMYHLRERFHSSMLSDYHGGPQEEYTTIDATNRGNFFDDDGRLQNGDGTQWNQFLSGLRGPTPYRSSTPIVNVANLIDFMLLWTSGSCESEFRAVGSPDNGLPFVFHMKDADGFLRDPDIAIPDPRNRYFAYVHTINHPGPVDALARMRSERDPDFQILVADRIHKHYFNDGVLTAPKHIARLQALVDQARLPYLAESARWGIFDGDTPGRNPDQWEDYQDNLLQNLFPELRDRQVTKLRNIGYYPDTEAPLFSQHGGSLPAGGALTMTSPEPHIYYTLDGSDPRLSGGAISPSAILATYDTNGDGPQDFISTGDLWLYLADGSDQGTVWRNPDYNDDAWLEGASELGYGENDEATDIGFVDTDPDTPANQRNATSYFRKHITIANPTDFAEFTLSIKYDDAAAVYVNGTQVVRTNNLPAGAAYDDFATSNTPDESTYFAFTLPSSRFVVGENTIAVEIHNSSASSGDVSFDLRLRGEVVSSTGNITEAIPLPEAATVNARSYDQSTGDWSALNSAFFSLDSVPANSDNLVISEFHYRPAEPFTPEEIAVSTDRDDYEFIEFLNIGTQPVELTGVSFTDGIEFAFTDNSLLAPGERLVLVRDAAAFTARYGGGVTISGEYSGRLSNSGEQIRLSSSDAGTIVEFSYTDETPWPIEADGGGPSLFLKNPQSNPDETLAASWEVHGTIGGAPGQPDNGMIAGYADWKLANNVTDDLADLDADGVPAIFEYALGTSPTEPSVGFRPRLGTDIDGDSSFHALEFASFPIPDDLVLEIQTSRNLIDWNPAPHAEVSPGVLRTNVQVDFTTTRKRFFRFLIRVIP